MSSVNRSKRLVAALRSLPFVAVLLAGGCVTNEETGQIAEEVHTVCAMATTIRGVDVSVYQGTIDWAAAASGGVKFTFIRHSHGTTTDTNFTRNWRGAGTAGILHGAYQYFSPWADAAAQANAIADGLESVGFGPGDLPPVLDVEQPGGGSNPALPAPATYAAHVQTWVDTIRSRLHVEPIIYTGGYYWDANVRSTAFASLILWHPQYFNYPGTTYNLGVTPLPGGACPTSVSNAWRGWGFWQFAGGNGRAPGFSGAVDLDVFNGTMAELRSLAVPAPMPDAGVDAGADVVSRDASNADGAAADASADVAADGSASDAEASSDSGIPSTDSSTFRDGSADGSTHMTPAGCGCRAENSSSQRNRAWIALVIVAIAVSRRKRSRD